MSVRVALALCALLFAAEARGGIFHVPKAGPNLPQKDIPTDLPPAVREKIVDLYSKDVKVRSEAAVSLGEMGSNAVGAIPYLVSMLDDDKGTAAIDRVPMMIFTVEELPGRMQSLMNKRRPGDYAAIALVAMGEPTVDPLIGALRNTWRDGYVIQIHWSNAAWALRMIGNPRAVDALVERLENKLPSSPEMDPETQVSIRGACSPAQFAAVAALGTLRDQRAVPSLVRFLAQREDKTCKQSAVGALAVLTGQSFGTDAAKWIAWRKQHDEGK